MAKRKWFKWYSQIIEKGSENIEEELKNCKDMLEVFGGMAYELDKRPPALYMDDLLEDLKDERIDVDDTVLGDKLGDLYGLLLEMRNVSPLYDCVKKYIEDKNFLNSFKRYEEAFSALTCATLLSIPYERRKNLLTPHVLEPRWKKGYSSRALVPHVFYGIRLVEGAVSLALSGKMIPFRILLRSALEIILKGILYEHLMVAKFRVSVDRAYWKRHDSVTRFCYQAQRKMRELKMGWEVLYYSFEGTPQGLRQARYLVRDPKIKDVIRWLEEWDVFYPLKNVASFVVQFYRESSQQLHGDMWQFSIQTAPEYSSAFLERVPLILDLTVLGILNTIENLMPKNSIRASRNKEPSDWERLAEKLRNSGLTRSEKRLKQLTERWRHNA